MNMNILIRRNRNLSMSIRAGISYYEHWRVSNLHRRKMCAHVTLITILGRIHTSFRLGPVFGACL